MKAVVLHEYGPPSKLKYEDAEDPRPGEGEVLVRVSATSLNPVDWKMRSGEAAERFPVEFPGIIGRDVAGVVRGLGEGVEGFTLGDRVMALAWHAYAELCVVPAKDLAKVPDKLEMTAAATIPLVAITGDVLVRQGAEAKKDQTIVVTGALGSVGRCAVFAANEIGAKIIAGVRRKQFDEAKKLPGVLEVIAIDDPASIADLGMIDCVADTVGGDIAPRLLSKVKQGGVFGSVLGSPRYANLHPTVKINAVMAQPDAAVTTHYAEAVRDGKLVLPVDRIMPLEDAAEAHTLAEKGGVKGKIVLTA